MVAREAISAVAVAQARLRPGLEGELTDGNRRLLSEGLPRAVPAHPATGGGPVGLIVFLPSAACHR